MNHFTITQDNAWRNDFISEYTEDTDYVKEIKKVSEYRWPKQMKQLFNSDPWLTEDDCKKNYREHLQIQHLFEINVKNSSEKSLRRSQLLTKLYNIGKQMEKSNKS